MKADADNPPPEATAVLQEGLGASVKPSECPACWLAITAAECGSPYCPKKDEEVERLLALSDDDLIAEVVAAGDDLRVLSDGVRRVIAAALARVKAPRP